MTLADPIIELRKVSKTFGRQTILSEVDLAIERGRTTVIIGRSGEGKSVLLKHMVGLIRPDHGEVRFEGQRIDHLNERALTPIRRKVSFVFQLNALFDSLSVLDNVAFAMRETGNGAVSSREIDALARRSLALVGMNGFEAKRPADLSGGEKKRVALARAIAVDPPPQVILYDEPTAGLDPQRADVINRLIRSLQRELGVTGVLVTHDMRSAAEVGDRVLMLYHGKFISDCTPAELLKTTDVHVRNFVEGRAEPDDVRPVVA